MVGDLLWEPALALAEISSILNSLSLPYYLVGSFASGMRGEFRATNDIDIVCRFDSDSVRGLFREAEGSFYCDEISIPNLLRERRSFNLIHKETFIKLDIFTRLTEFELDQFTRASKCRIPKMEVEVNVSTAEYNILAKLRWYKMSNFQLQRQLQDVRAMIEINKDTLDLKYLDHWSKVLGVSELFEKVGLADSI